MIDLKKRLTFGYVGTYQHLDKWETLGMLDEIGQRELPLSEEEQADICEPKRHEVFAVLTLDPAAGTYDRWTKIQPADKDLDYHIWLEKEIQTALCHTYSRQGCAHEYDCCGCRSHSASSAQRVTGNLWRVEIHSSRNY